MRRIRQFGRASHCSMASYLLIGRILPNHMSGRPVRVINFDFHQKLHRAVAVDGDKDDERRVEIFKTECAMYVDTSSVGRSFDDGV